MLWRRGRALFLPAAALVAVLAIAGCGRNDFKNDPSPPVPAEVSVKIATDGVVVSPKEFGAGLVNFTAANLTNQTGSLTIRGPVSAETDAIGPGDTQTIKLQVKSGSYEASASGIGVRPFSFTVGPERPTAQNQLLLP
ncbi:MAG TPA: hypothetical protein VHU24_11405 [Solirubrobacterales bacterium]|nr:hypothetical protein [Solirubrobacterales bacterium]